MKQAKKQNKNKLSRKQKKQLKKYGYYVDQHNYYCYYL